MSVHAGTRNAGLHVGPLYEVAQLSAAGFQWPPGLNRDPALCAKTQPRFNGGIVSAIEVRLQRDDLVYRFADSRKKTLAEQLLGNWWFDYDTCLYLMSVSGRSQQALKDAARSAFAVLDDFKTDMGVLVKGKLAADFWAFKGITATADNKNPKLTDLPFGLYKGGNADSPAPAPSVMSDRHGVNALQLYVPGGFQESDFVAVGRIIQV